MLAGETSFVYHNYFFYVSNSYYLKANILTDRTQFMSVGLLYSSCELNFTPNK